eukprot:2440258-Rhodomonas_salina.4
MALGDPRASGAAKCAVLTSRMGLPALAARLCLRKAMPCTNVWRFCTRPSLSDKLSYPLFSRSVPSDTLAAEVTAKVAPACYATRSTGRA